MDKYNHLIHEMLKRLDGVACYNMSNRLRNWIFVTSHVTK